METSQKSTSDSRGGGGRGRGSGRGGGRNPWGRGKERSNVQAFTGSAGMVRPGTNVVWSKWLAAAKETLRTQYGSQVESLERVLPEEATPVEKSELNAAALSNKINIEYFRHELKTYEDWEKKAELRKGIRLALLDKCNTQVKTVLFPSHAIETIENLTCQVTDLVAWISQSIYKLLDLYYLSDTIWTQRVFRVSNSNIDNSKVISNNDNNNKTANRFSTTSA